MAILLSTINSVPRKARFHDAPTVVEQKLFVMFLEHPLRTFKAFHASPDYALWFGWSDAARPDGA